MLDGVESIGSELGDNDDPSLSDPSCSWFPVGCVGMATWACLTSRWSKEKGHSLRFITPNLLMESGGIHSLVTFLL